MKTIGVARNYRDLHAVLRSRAEAMHLTREQTDTDADLAPGYAGKLLAPVPIRSVGATSLGPLLRLFGLALIVVEDNEEPDSALRPTK